ncbi:uncharacterized protein LOC101240152 [Hydra vulgaris]|uniref:uncharacterized protein LOC101240152 n=1 Tax=Hydra vulgaris TaxID=6087 RepID=UPI001F5F5B81|nr:uncharacterized protein LOC101240152 [Hydra vulgaris]
MLIIASEFFFFGDYQFLCALYGISGATGRHCCLFCNATSTDMKGIESQSAEIKVRTLENLYTDYKSFIEKGGQLYDAKHFNNVITEPMLKIPLDQVSLPSLHMALGIYLNFFNFFEDEVHELDVLLAAEEIKMTNNYTASYSEEYQIFVKKQKELSNLQCEIVCLNEKLQSINDIALLAAIQNSDYGMNVQSLYNSDIDSINFKKGVKTNQYNTLMQKHSL